MEVCYKTEMWIWAKKINVDTGKLSQIAPVVPAVAAARPPECRQEPEVRESLNGLRVRWRLKAVVRQAQWKTLPVNVRLQEKGIQRTGDCAILEGRKTMNVRLNKCSYLDVPFQSVREMYTRVEAQGKAV